MTITTKSFSHLILHLLIITLLLIVGGFGLFHYLKSTKISLLSVETVPSRITISGRLNQPLLKNDSLKVEFTNTLPRLGIVSLRFLTFSRINTDSLTFSIKQVGEKKWYYTNAYKTDQFQPGQLFPFGFPEISASENEVFNLEITSLSGTPSSAVALGRALPLITTRQVFTLADFKMQPLLLIRFLVLKLFNILSDVRSLNQLLISFFPLVVYIVVYPKIKNKFTLFTLMMFLLLMVIGTSASGPIIELISAVAVISCAILTAHSFGKIIRYQRKNGHRHR